MTLRWRTLASRTFSPMYSYVGPADIRSSALGQPAGTDMTSRAQLVAWLAGANAVGQPITFVISLAGDLVLAPRESEHVAAAHGAAVLSAGEIAFDLTGAVLSASNQSTGYCPEPSSWADVARALDALGVPHPAAFTAAYDFRRCPACGSVNLVKDSDFNCAVCRGKLPAEWNFG